jgi:hypothetical protein
VALDSGPGLIGAIVISEAGRRDRALLLDWYKIWYNSELIPRGVQFAARTRAQLGSLWGDDSGVSWSPVGVGVGVTTGDGGPHPLDQAGRAR